MTTERRGTLVSPGPHLILVLLLIALIGANAAWLIVDRHPTDMDQSRYMLMALEYAESWRDPGPATLAAAWIGNHPTHPHLLPLIASVPFEIFDSRDAAYFVNTLFHAGVVLFVFLIGRRLGSPGAGLVAAFLAAGLPLLSRFSRYFLLEEAATFFVAALLYSLLRSDGLEDTRWAALCGALSGFALLTKWTAVVFVAPPTLIVAAAALLRRPPARVLRSLAILGAGCAAVAAPWYWAHRAELLRFFDYAEKGGLFAGDGPGIAQLGFYLLMLWATSGWPFLALGAVGLLYLVRRPSREHWAILSVFLVPLLVFALLISTRDVRHLLPGLPAVVVGAGLALRSLRRSWLREGLTAAVLLLSVFSAAYTAWGFGELDSKLTIGHHRALVLPEAHPPDGRDWRLDQLLERAASDHRSTRPRGAIAPVRVVAGNQPFRTESFAYSAALRFPSLRIVHTHYFLPPGQPEHQHLGLRSLLQPGYLVLREGDVNSNANGMFDYSRALKRYLDRTAASGLFRTIYATRLPTGHLAKLLRVEPFRCDGELLQLLDWVHEIDHDDPDIPGIVDDCAAREATGSSATWQQLAEAIRLQPADAKRVATLRRLLDEFPDLRWPRRLLADSFVARHKPAAAAVVYAELGDGTPYLCSPHLSAGDTWRLAGAAAEARISYRRAVADSPDCLRAHRELAGALHAAGQMAAARSEERKIELLEHQVRLGPTVDSARIRLLLGEVAARGGDVEEALYYYTAARESEPGNAEAQQRLEELSGNGAGSTAWRG